jgi:tRNA (guanine37-N1)-methyltransferase
VLQVDIITIFPDFFSTVFDYGIIRRAKLAQLIDTRSHDLRQWTEDKHHQVDDRPFGGGEGMVLKPDPIFRAVESLTGAGSASEMPAKTRVILMSPQGRVLTQKLLQQLAEQDQIVIICGRYEGVDERVSQALATDEISIGDYVLSGGEPAALVLVDAITRLIPGALGNETSALNDSFSDGLLDYPQYTRPPEFRGMTVPEVLLKGHHAEIARWRRRESLKKTMRNRPDLLNERMLTETDRKLLEED